MKDINDASFNDRWNNYREHIGEAADWLECNLSRLKELYSNVRLRDFVFEPIKGVFDHNGEDPARTIRQTITMVSVANAVMAGLPGKMGVGVAVSMALEGWMAYVIATKVGFKLKSVADVWTYFGLLVAIGGVVFYGFRVALGAAFSLFSIIPGLNPLILAELVITNLVGVLFWVGFEEAKSTGRFTVPKRALIRVGSETRSLAAFQWSMIRSNLNPTALRQMGCRLKAWLRGEIPLDYPLLRGQIAPAVMMSSLLSGNHEQLSGPVGREFVAAIQDRFPELQDATMGQITEHMSSYEPEQLFGVINLIKGKLFERLVVLHVNEAGNEWRARLHEDESYPGSDVILVNEETEEIIELSLKATDSSSYVEDALMKYPDIPVLTTEEVSKFFDGDPRVMGATLSNEDLQQVTEENFERLLGALSPTEVAEGAATGVAVGAAIDLWPFVVAFLKKRISQDQLEQAFVRVLGESGVSLASRVSYAVILGPVFAWYLLARAVMAVTRAANSGADVASRRLEWIGPQT